MATPAINYTLANMTNYTLANMTNYTLANVTLTNVTLVTLLLVNNTHDSGNRSKYENMKNISDIEIDIIVKDVFSDDEDVNTTYFINNNSSLDNDSHSINSTEEGNMTAFSPTLFPPWVWTMPTRKRERRELNMPEWDYDHDLEELIRKIYLGCVSFFGGAFCAPISLAFSGMSMGIWLTKEMASTASIYMIVLNTYEFLIQAMNLMIGGIVEAYTYITADYSWYNTLVMPMMSFNGPLKEVFISSSVYTALALSVDRAIAVVMPMRHPTICTPRRVQVALVFCHIAAWIINIPPFFAWKSTKLWFPLHQSYEWFPVKTSFYYSVFYSEIYIKVLVPSFNGLVVIGQVVLNCILVHAVFKMSKESKKMSGATQSKMKEAEKPSSRDGATQRIIKQVIFISVASMISRINQILTFVFMVLIYNQPFINRIPSIYAAVYITFTHTYTYTGGILNFFCFCYFGAKFRNVFLTKICCGYGVKKKEDKKGLPKQKV